MTKDLDPALFPVDPDVDLHIPAQRRELREHPVTVLGAISCGGLLGALARYGLGAAYPHQPWTTLIINATGCLLIGVLMVLITQLWPDQRLLRPFFGTGVLGGYTTFSTYTVDIQHLISTGAPRTALLYLGATVLAALLAVYLGVTLTRAALRVTG
jgi:CrcB protein